MSRSEGGRAQDYQPGIVQVSKLWDGCPFTAVFRATRERERFEQTCMALSVGAHKYPALDQVILLLVRSKTAVIGGSPMQAATLERWAVESGLEQVLDRLPPSWRLATEDAA